MTPGESLRDAITRGVELTANEAVAIVQQLLASPNVDVDQPRPSGRLSLDSIRLDADGSVACGASIGPPGVPEIGMLLAEMLPPEGTTRVPGALRYTIARALSQVDAPPFASLAQLSAALARHEQRARVAVLRDLYARAAMKLPADRAIDVDRRRRTPSASILRRQLREADEALFAHLHRTAPAPEGARPALPERDAIEPCVVHRVEARTALAGERFGGARRWALGGGAAVLISFGVGYAVVAGVRSPNVGRPDVPALTQGPASAAATTDANRPSRADAMSEHDTARRSGGPESSRPGRPPRR